MAYRMKMEHECSICGRIVARSELTVKKSVFVTPGEGGKTLRSRVVAHLCPSCVVTDSDWNRPANQRLEAKVS